MSLSLPARAACLLALGASLALAACQAPAAPALPNCPAPASPATRVELFFGRGIPGGGEVSEAEWQAFLDGEITPLFPDGLTVVDLTGQWRDTATGEIVEERSKQLILFAFEQASLAETIAGITAAYRERYQQQAVLGTYEPACVAFH